MKIKIKKKVLYSLLSLLLGAVVSAYVGATNQQQILKTKAVEPTTVIKNTYKQTVRVTEVIDGDTFKIETGQKVRLIGVDTPELHHPTKGVQCFGKEAMLKTKELIDGKEVRLEKDVSETDRYGRLLRYVYVIDPNASSSAGLFLNDYLMKEGYARVLTVPPDVSKADVFRASQDEAMNAQKGLWKACQ
jgi:micrococcal nuclease